MNLTNKKILIAQETDIASKLQDVFKAMNAICTILPRDGKKVKESINSFTPDILIMSEHMSEIDSLDLMNTMDKEKMNNMHVFVFSNTGSSMMETALFNSGIDGYFIKPFNVHNVVNRIIYIIGGDNSIKPLNNIANIEHDIYNTITELMKSFGIPAHIKGYRYIREAIIMGYNDPKCLECVTKILYPNVAKACDTTPSRTERAIRHAIEVAWDRCDVDVLSEYFGYTVNPYRGKPTNSEFIAMIVDTLKTKYNK